MRIEVIPREEFLSRRWVYRPGEHVTLLAPTGGGKTYLAAQLLDHALTGRLRAVALVMKPRDKTAAMFAKRLKLRVVRTWPPMPSIWQPQPRGWVLWPKHRFDPQYDDLHLHREFRKALLDSYKKGDRIIFGDEVAGLVDDLGLERELKAIWSRGRSMGAGLWSATQRPSHIPLLAYNSAEHLFLAYDPDKRNQDRFSEIGGVDPALVKSTVLELGKWQWLYIRRSDRAMCIVDK